MVLNQKREVWFRYVILQMMTKMQENSKERKKMGECKRGDTNIAKAKKGGGKSAQIFPREKQHHKKWKLKV